MTTNVWKRPIFLYNVFFKYKYVAKIQVENHQILT